MKKALFTALILSLVFAGSVFAVTPSLLLVEPMTDEEGSVVEEPTEEIPAPIKIIHWFSLKKHGEGPFAVALTGTTWEALMLPVATTTATTTVVTETEEIEPASVVIDASPEMPIVSESRAGGLERLVAMATGTTPLLLTDRPIVAVSADGKSVSTASTTLSEDGRMLELFFEPALAIGYCYMIDLSSGTNLATSTANHAIVIRTLPGDVNGDGIVDAKDILAVRDNAGKVIDNSTAVYDVTGNGKINMGDTWFIRFRVGDTVKCE